MNKLETRGSVDHHILRVMNNVQCQYTVHYSSLSKCDDTSLPHESISMNFLVYPHLTGLLVRVSLYPPELHEVEGTGEVACLSVVLHCLLVVEDLTRRKVRRDTVGEERRGEREEGRGERGEGREERGERRGERGKETGRKNGEQGK